MSSRTTSVTNQSWKSAAMPIGQQTDRHVEAYLEHDLLWWMFYLLQFEDTESSVTLFSRVRNICCCFRNNGWNLIRLIFSWLLGCHMLMCLYLDSSAAIGILSRKGVGRLRHLGCRVLWLQDLVCQKLFLVTSVLGAVNPADIATKRLSASRLQSDRNKTGRFR